MKTRIRIPLPRGLCVFAPVKSLIAAVFGAAALGAGLFALVSRFIVGRSKR